MRNFDGFYRGINLGGWISQCGPNYNEQHYMSFVTEDDIAKIADMGLDHVRMPVDYNVIQTEDGELIESGMKHIEDCVNWCKKYGLNILIDLHKTCGFFFDKAHNESGFFDNEDLQKRFYALWEEFAARYSKYAECGSSDRRKTRNFDARSKIFCMSIRNLRELSVFCNGVTDVWHTGTGSRHWWHPGADSGW